MYALKTSHDLDSVLRLFTTDKEYGKIFVSQIVGERYTIPTEKILTSREEIFAYEFPDRCCIKPTHSSGIYIVRQDGEDLPLDEIAGWLDHSYYTLTRERNYKELDPKIIVEPLVFGRPDPNDYKFYCYNGKVKFIQVSFDRIRDRNRVFYDNNWSKLPFNFYVPVPEQSIPKPRCLPQMIEVAEKLASYFPIVRIDLYANEDEFVVGEITHCANGASGVFTPSGGEEAASRMFFSN